MRYLKTFESYTVENGQKSVENLPHFAKLQEVINYPEISADFQKFVEKLKGADSTLVESLFQDTELASELLYKEVVDTYRIESMRVDSQSMARQALKHLLAIGAIAALVKLFYKVGDYVFSNLDEQGIPAIAGGVLVVLLYLAFGKSIGGMFSGRKKPVQPEDELIDSEEM
jgi:hypothetical protein